MLYRIIGASSLLTGTMSGDNRSQVLITKREVYRIILVMVTRMAIMIDLEKIILMPKNRNKDLKKTHLLLKAQSQRDTLP